MHYGEYLDNPIWSALHTGNKATSFGNEQAMCIDREMGFFAGMPLNSRENFQHLHGIAEAGRPVILFTSNEIVIPAGWKVKLKKELLQMINERPAPGTEDYSMLQPLSDQHIPAMIELTSLTNPGPFISRTIDFGNYEGIFAADRLVAMTGQRLRPGPFVEVSAVCTHPDFTGKGYAALLIKSQLNKIASVSKIPMLHVYPENGAVHLYKKLGFEVRKEMWVYMIEKLG